MGTNLGRDMLRFDSHRSGALCAALLLGAKIASANEDVAINKHYVARYTPDLYGRTLAHLAESGGVSKIRIAEQPVFLSRGTQRRIRAAAEQVVAKLSHPKTSPKLHHQLPAGFYPLPDHHSPEIAIIDFALTWGQDGELHPQLIELQGFANYHALVHEHGLAIQSTLNDEAGLSAFEGYEFVFGGTAASYRERLKAVLVGEAEPRMCALVDYDPSSQHFRQDFQMSERLLGVRPACVTDLQREGQHLYYKAHPEWGPVQRLYNRVVPGDPAEKDFPIAFNYWDPEIEVQRMPHPAWYFLWAKQSMVHLDLSVVPKLVRLADLERLPSNLKDYVLKPLWNFGGNQVVIGPTAGDIDAVDPAQRDQWALQERVQYAAWLPAIDGGEPLRTEVRVVTMRTPQENKLKPLTTWLRLSRGDKMNADYNTTTATGVSLAFWPAN